MGVAASAGLLSHMLLIGGRTPYKILFARASGKTFQIDFYPVYDQRGMLERSEPVPFRLTRNLHTFFTPFGIEGVFVSAMAAAAQVRCCYAIPIHPAIYPPLSTVCNSVVCCELARAWQAAPTLLQPLEHGGHASLIMLHNSCKDRINEQLGDA